jgi:hypothetical protein
MASEPDLVPRVYELLSRDEQVVVNARAEDGLVAVTDRRLIVVDPIRVTLDIPFERLRRIQFDIESTRPATLVVVPEEADDRPQVLSIPPEQYQATADAIVRIGIKLAERQRAS